MIKKTRKKKQHCVAYVVSAVFMSLLMTTSVYAQEPVIVQDQQAEEQQETNVVIENSPNLIQGAVAADENTASEETTAEEITYGPIHGTQTSMMIYVAVKNDSFLPQVEFHFDIQPGETGEYDGIPVKPGIGDPVLDPADMTFGTEDLYRPYLEDIPEGGEQISKQGYIQKHGKMLTIDFENVFFTEPGVYRYVISEKKEDYEGITFDTNSEEKDLKRILDVVVVDADGELFISDYHFSDTEEATSNQTSDTEVQAYIENADTEREIPDYSQNDPDNFVHEYHTENMEVSLAIDGTGAKKDKYFRYLLTFDNAIPNSIFQITATSERANNSENTAEEIRLQKNPIVIVNDDNGYSETEFYLTDGDAFKVTGITEGVHYQLIPDPEDYRTVLETKDGFTDQTEGDIGIGSVKLAYTNIKGLTGILRYLIYIVPAVVVIGIICAIIITSNKKKKNKVDKETKEEE